jgi:hypothetical protein
MMTKLKNMLMIFIVAIFQLLLLKMEMKLKRLEMHWKMEGLIIEKFATITQI